MEQFAREQFVNELHSYQKTISLYQGLAATLKNEFIAKYAFKPGDKVLVHGQTGIRRFKTEAFVRVAKVTAQGRIIYGFSAVKKDGTQSLNSAGIYSNDVLEIELIQAANPEITQAPETARPFCQPIATYNHPGLDILKNSIDKFNAGKEFATVSGEGKAMGHASEYPVTPESAAKYEHYHNNIAGRIRCPNNK